MVFTATATDRSATGLRAQSKRPDPVTTARG